ncbi:MAG: hypothetical protein Q9163_001175 [Psora crenata]
MKRIALLPSSPLFCTSDILPLPLISLPAFKCLHTSPTRSATPLPITATGPPPAAPLPAASQYGERIDRRRRQAELLKRGQDLRISQIKPGSAMKKRFWKDVHVHADKREAEAGKTEGTHSIYLDSRPVPNPATKTALQIPSSKPHLATAIGLEWDLLTSAQQALRSHLIPLTSLAARAHCLSLEDQQSTGTGRLPSAGGEGMRYEIVNTLLRYLDTDTLLCWAPSPTTTTAAVEQDREEEEEQGRKWENVKGKGRTLREVQILVARPILAYLAQSVWPGVELRETLDEGSILPRAQPAATRAVIQGWMAGLPAWELVGLERAALATKSLCIGARLVCEWSEELSFWKDGASPGQEKEVREGGEEEGEEIFGVEEAAKASSLEVAWQTGRWGEVEDSHDVEKEDLKRQLGSVVLLVGGTKGSTQR